MLRRGRGEGGPPVDPRRATGLVMVGAVAVAPLLGLLYGREVGLGVLVVALVATIGVAVRSAPAVPAETRGRLRALIGVNVAILIVAVVVIVMAIA